jgi:hypothetical protein
VEDALRRAVEEIGRWPDLVVVLGVLDAAWEATLLRVPGVDLAYLRFETDLSPVEVDTTFQGSGARGTRLSGLALRPSPWRVEVTDLWLGDLVTVRHLALPLTADEAVDPWYAERVQALRQPVLEAGSTPILADVTDLLEKTPGKGGLSSPGQDAADLARREQALYGNLTSAIVLEATGADVALTPPPREMWRVGGGFTEVRIRAALPGQETLVAVVLDGAALEKVVAEARAQGVGVAGTVGSEVAGRPVESKERYVVVTTDALAVQLGLDERVRTRRFWTVGGRLVPAAVGGKVVVYRDVVLARLRAIKRTHAPDGTFGPAYLAALSPYLRTRGDRLTTRLVLEARDLTASLAMNTVRGREAYPHVPENRVRTPGYTSILVGGTFRAALESRLLTTELRGTGRWDWRRYSADGKEETREAENTWTATLELRSPLLSVTIPRVRVRTEPFASLSYESLFARPQVDRLRVRLPDVALGRASAGMAFFAPVLLKELRVGVVAQEDFTLPLYRPSGLWRAPGLSLGVESSGLLSYDIGRVTVETTGRLRVLAPRPSVDTDRDLAAAGGCRVAGKTRLLEGLSLSAFSDLFVYQGKMAMDRPGFSFLVGVGVAADRQWKPMTEVGLLW